MFRRFLAAITIATVVGGCASMRSVKVGSESSSTSATTYTVDVYNSHSATITVSYSDTRGEHELGTVGAGQTGHFYVAGSSSPSVTIMGMTSSGGHYTKNVTLGSGTTKVTL